MITIKLSPVRSDKTPLEVAWYAPILHIKDGPQEYDLSMLPDGATAKHEILGDVSRIGDDYQITLILPHGPNAPYETRFPADIIVIEDGVIDIPIYGE